jgi:hypothetical protein
MVLRPAAQRLGDAVARLFDMRSIKIRAITVTQRLALVMGLTYTDLITSPLEGFP